MADLVYKFITDAIKEVKEEDRSLIAWASKSSMDRDDEEIDASGWITKDYEKNPVVPLFHDYHQFPMAKSKWVKREPRDKPVGLLFMPVFADTAIGNESFYLYQNGFMNAFSVGFDPIEWMDSDGEIHSREKDGAFAIWQKGHIEQKKKKPRCKFLKQILLEISGVLVPAHPDALVEARSHVKTPELSKYLDEMIDRSRKPMIQAGMEVPLFAKDQYTITNTENSIKIEFSKSANLKAILKDGQVLVSPLKHIDTDDLDDLGDDDIDLDEWLGSDGDALGDSGDVSEIDLVEMLGESGDDAEVEDSLITLIEGE